MKAAERMKKTADQAVFFRLWMILNLNEFRRKLNRINELQRPANAEKRIE
ncbi:MAG: hypothetical protein WBD10_01940 [Acidobacteriaceae bacterium]